MARRKMKQVWFAMIGNSPTKLKDENSLISVHASEKGALDVINNVKYKQYHVWIEGPIEVNND